MKKTLKILLVEDDPNLGSLLSDYLNAKGHLCVLRNNGEEGYKSFVNESFDFVILDVMMPIKDGFTLAKEIRKENTSIPIIFLTAKSQTKDVLDGFDHGGNDYLKKPFSMEELIVRIKALLDRNKIKKDTSKIAIGNYIFNYTKQVLHFLNEEVLLTNKESELLFHLSEKRNDVLDRSFILKKLWGNDDFFNARSMDVFISKLRKKLSKDPSIKIINIRGFGYKLTI